VAQLSSVLHIVGDIETTIAYSELETRNMVLWKQMLEVAADCEKPATLNELREAAARGQAEVDVLKEDN